MRAVNELDIGIDSPESIYARYRGPLISYFRRRGQLRSDAEDLTQQVFVRLFGWDRGDSATIGPSFMFTIAQNLLRDRRRSAIRQGEELGLEHAEFLVHSQDRGVQAATQERTVVAKDALNAIAAALGELEVETQKIFVLARVELMPYPEIAAIYGCSTKTVQREVAKAVSHLMRRLGSD